jgi:hypothetical protein
VKALRAGKDLACAKVNCKVWKLAMALQLSVIKSYVLKVVNRSNIQSKTQLGVTPSRDNLIFLLSAFF